MLKLKHSASDKVLMNLEFKESLIYYDYPILFIMNDKENNLFLFLALDEENHIERHLMVPVTQDDIDGYLKNHYSLRVLVKKEFVNIIDRDFTTGEDINWMQVNFEDMPEEYLPTTDSFFE